MHAVNRGDFPDENLLTRVMAVKTGLPGGASAASDRREEIMEWLRVLLQGLSQDTESAKLVKVWVYDTGEGEWERVKDCIKDCENIRRNYEKYRLAFGQFDPATQGVTVEWQR